jgi:hypothetical protein
VEIAGILWTSGFRQWVSPRFQVIELLSFLDSFFRAEMKLRLIIKKCISAEICVCGPEC